MRGVEKFVTDMKRHRVIVTGRIDPEKLLKKLRKKTGKRVEIVCNKDGGTKDAIEEADPSMGGFPNPITRSMVLSYCGEWSVLCAMFSDENANACLIM
ncbi:peroxidase [Sarracenia purpurea var. burkii]